MDLALRITTMEMPPQLPHCGACISACRQMLSRADFVRYSPLLINDNNIGFWNYKYHRRFAMAAAQALRTTLRTTRLVSPTNKLFSPHLYKPFSTTVYRAMLTTELSEAEVSALRANKERLANDLHESCQWGSGIRWGE
jgi:hypothetical protein